MMDGSAQLEREGIFTRMLSTDVRRDFASFDTVVHADLVLTLPGGSPIAGTYRGRAAFRQYLDESRKVLRPSEKPIVFRHEGQDLIATNEIIVSGPTGAAGMLLHVRTTFDPDQKVVRIVLEPADLRLFDFVLANAMIDA